MVAMAEIRLGGAFGHLTVLVDDDQHERLSQYSWCRLKGRGTDYAVARVEGRLVQMHRLLLDAPTGVQVDHRNRNGLDNRMENLRFASNRQQRANQGVRTDSGSRLKGVYFVKSRELGKPYRAQIKVDGVTRSLGYFASAEEAAAAYDAAAVQEFGEFAVTNGSAS